MNKPTLLRISLVLISLLMGMQTIAQNYVPFSPRFDQDLKGDIVLIGNNILGPDNNAFNDDNVYNHNVDMQYIDIDGDPTTFSSSSADLEILNPNCYQIRYAGLYWGAVTSGGEPITEVKFKGPTGGYNDITGTLIFDAGGSSVDGGNSFPYACYADVTGIVTGLTNDLGTYTVANVSSAVGETSTFDPYNGTGYSSGWSLFIVYEDPTLPGKSITSFDGFSSISVPGNNETVDVPVSGFRTVPAPAPVRANFAFATLEGDKPIQGDQLKMNGTSLSAADRPVANFFNSSVTQLDATPVTNRNPNSTNTLGFDTGVMSVPNPGNAVLGNDDTSAVVTLETSGDTFFPYFFAFAVEIIEPSIVLTKIVEDEFGNNIGGQTVDLGQELNYVIGFQNVGNDNATNFTIRDILPINIIFDYPTDLVLPPGVSVLSYDPTTREIVFSIENYLVEENDPVYEIRIEVTVVESCQQLADSCSNIINNQAYATYQGTLNPTFIITDDPSYSNNTGCLISPQATNFLADLDDCVFTQNETLCGESIQLTAANGYDEYSWSTSPTGTPVIGTGQTITVTETGTYYSFNTAIAPCQSIVQEYNVTLYGGNISNPVIPYADEVVTCPDDGKLLPNIFLCGEDDFREIQTDIDGAVSIIWEQLEEASCPAVADDDCANENGACTWNQVATGPDYTANMAGQFRLTINYQGGCFNQFYFNVYQNLLDPTVTVEDIICNTPGSITVHNVPSGYEYSLDDVNYQAGNIFTITTPGLYTVYVRQIGIPSNACVFTVPDVLVRERDFTVSSLVSQPLCYGELGSIYLAANDVEPQYFFSLYQGGTLVNSVGPIVENNYVFANLNPGTYTATVETEDGCTYTEEITIIEPPQLTATAAITIPLTCTNGEITVYPQGGTAPYFYFVNNSVDFQTTPEIVVTTAGVYEILVVDSNNCTAEVTINIEASLPPDFMVTTTDILCADAGETGTISIDVTNPNGNSLEYSIDGGATFSASSLFTGLAAGSYEVVVEYTNGPSVCVTDPQTVTIDAVAAISGTAELIAPYTCSNTGTITVNNVTGGTAPYQYSIDGINFQSSPTFSGLTAGTYSITILDANDCTFITNEITIPPLDPPTDLTFSHTPLTCPTNVTTVTIISTTGGVTPLEYRIIAPAAAVTPYQSSNEFSGLTPGVYTFQVRDDNDCIYSESYSIDPLPTIDVIAQTLNDVSCVGDANGSAQFIVSGTTGFVYSINGGASTSGTSPVVLNGLAAGTYNILVTDTTTNCEGTAMFVIEEPGDALAVTVDTSPITCISDGSVEIIATGGWSSYTYTLTLPDGTQLPSQTNDTFYDLSQAGTYNVTVEDGNGCEVSSSFDLTIPNPPVASISVSSDLCYDTTNGATIEITVTSGEAPYEYSMNGGPFQASNVFTNLMPGTYTVTVRDAFGCETTLSAQTIADELTVDAVLTKGLDCTVSPDAIISGTINGGTAPFTYAVSYNGGAFTSLGSTGSSFTYSTPNDGTYQFEITDDTGCTALSPVITVNPLTLPAIDIISQTQPILCNGDTNAAIDITIDSTTGTPPFVINVNNDTTGTDYGTQTSGLAAGTYTITVTDGNSCEATDSITITQPDPIVVDYDSIDITCTAGGVSQGSIIINNVMGGTAPYNYFVTGSNGYSNSELNATGSTSVSFDVVDFGLYEINVVDANGCSVLIQDVLVASPPSDLDIDIDLTVDCLLGGEATVSVSSGLASPGPFHFAIYQGPGTVYPNPPGAWLPENPPGSQSTTFVGLTPGVTYTFIVYDESTMCSYYEPATLPIPTNSTLSVTAVSSDNITCTGSADGDVSFTVNSIYGIPVDVSFEIFDSLSLTSTGISGNGIVPAGGSLVVSDLGPLPFGTYYVLIEEVVGPNAGCGVVTAPFTITESAFLLSLSATVDQNANCNPTSGVVSAVAQNGTPPYQYQITTTPGAPTPTDPLWSTPSTFNVDAGNYYVHVIDAYGCIISSPVQVVPMDPSPVISAINTNQCDTAEGDFEIEVTLTSAGTAPYSISIDGGSFQSQTLPFIISNLNSGVHTIEINDVNGCGNLETITIEPPLAIDPMITALPSCDDDDGEITVTATGGTGSYSYTISPNPPSISLSGNVFSGVPSGTYTVTVTDASTACSEDVSVTLDAATPVVFTSEVNDVSCNGGGDGSIEIILPPVNDNPVYTYEITAPISVPTQTSPVFSGLSAGTYTVQVVSGRGCIAVQDIVVNEPDLLEAFVTASEFLCDANNTTNTVTLTITESGGTPGFNYSIDGINYFATNTFEIADTGTVQNITVYVRDANNCVATESITIDPLPVITAAAASEVTPIDCNGTGTVEIDVTGGSGNFTYQLLPNGANQASNVFSINAPGTYYFQVNDLDTDCYFLAEPFVVDPFDTLTAELSVTQVNDCFGDSNGELSLLIDGYTGAYTYQLIDGSGVAIGGTVNANTSTNPWMITGLPSGTYTVDIVETETPFCSASSNAVTVSAPPSPLAIEVQETANVTCDNSQGVITAIADGGTAAYEFELSGDATVAFSSDNVFPGLSAGNYTVTVRDANGCLESASIELIEPTPIDADFVPNTNMLNCFGDQNATITAMNITGGQVGNYSFTLNTTSPGSATSGPQTSNVFENLGAGTYTVTITDGYGCFFTSLPVTIEEPEPILANLVAESTPTCLTQASLTLSANGGTGTYEYSANASFSPVIGSFTDSVTFNVTQGTYNYYVRDANGCIANVSNEITIDPLPELEIELVSTNPQINCAGDATGIIEATAFGGLGNYIYTLQDTMGNTIAAQQDTPGTFTGLTAGTYVVFVESGDCAETSETITITEPQSNLDYSVEVTNVICNGEDNGMIQITATGGTGIIQYAISPQLNQFFNVGTFDNLAADTYFIIVQDELGCYLTFEVEVVEPDPVIISIVPDSIVPELCAGDANGAFSIEIEGGTAPYSVSLDNYNGPYTTGDIDQTLFEFTDLSGGIHTVYVRDAAGCESEWNIPLPEPILLDPMVEVEYICEDNVTTNIVTVTVDESNTDPDELSYSLNDGPFQANPIFENLPASTDNYITVMHSNGCMQMTEFFDIESFEPLSLILTNENLNEIEAIASGGTGSYEFTLNGENFGALTTFAITESGIYIVTVTDESGCIATATITVEFIDICLSNYFTPNGDGIIDYWAPGCAENYPNLMFSIYDRYGRRVATLRQGDKWDGRYNNTELPTGDYWYVVQLRDGNDREFVGHFTLYR